MLKKAGLVCATLFISVPTLAENIPPVGVVPELLRSEKSLSQFIAMGYEVKAAMGAMGVGLVLQKGPSIVICGMKETPKIKDTLTTDKCYEAVK